MSYVYVRGISASAYRLCQDATDEVVACTGFVKDPQKPMSIMSGYRASRSGLQGRWRLRAVTFELCGDAGALEHRPWHLKARISPLPDSPMLVLPLARGINRRPWVAAGWTSRFAALISPPKLYRHRYHAQPTLA